MYGLAFDSPPSYRAKGELGMCTLFPTVHPSFIQFATLDLSILWKIDFREGQINCENSFKTTIAIQRNKIDETLTGLKDVGLLPGIVGLFSTGAGRSS